MNRRRTMLIACAALALGVVIGRATLPTQPAVASQASAASLYSGFAGQWYHHGGSMVISATGHTLYTYRLYVDCTAGRTTACDKFSKNVIYEGGFSRFALHTRAGNTARGTMTDSVFSWQMATSVTLVLRPNDTLILREAGVGPTVFCGPRAPVGFCGA